MLDKKLLFFSTSFSLLRIPLLFLRVCVVVKSIMTQIGKPVCIAALGWLPGLG
jgi:hypothetical protein